MRTPKESKDEKFHRLAEARVNKILHLFRLLGNLSWTANYAYSKEQVEQIFTTLQLELVKTKLRFLRSQERIKKRFCLSEPYDVEEPVIKEDNPAFAIPLPDGTYLRAVGYPNYDYPCINIYWDNGINLPTDALCFVEFNPEKDGNMRVCIGTYRSDEEDTAYYPASYGPQNQEGGQTYQHRSAGNWQRCRSGKCFLAHAQRYPYFFHAHYLDD